MVLLLRRMLLFVRLLYLLLGMRLYGGVQSGIMLNVHYRSMLLRRTVHSGPWKRRCDLFAVLLFLGILHLQTVFAGYVRLYLPGTVRLRHVCRNRQ